MSHSKNNSARYYHKCHRSSHRVSFILVRFLLKLTLSDKFKKKNPQISNFMKIRPVCAQLFHVGGQSDGRIDMTKLIVAMQFLKAPQN